MIASREPRADGIPKACKLTGSGLPCHPSALEDRCRGDPSARLFGTRIQHSDWYRESQADQCPEIIDGPFDLGQCFGPACWRRPPAGSHQERGDVGERIDLRNGEDRLTTRRLVCLIAPQGDIDTLLYEPYDRGGDALRGSTVASSAPASVAARHKARRPASPVGDVDEIGGPAALNTSLEAGRLDATPWVGDHRYGLPGRVAGPGQVRPAADSCDASGPTSARRRRVGVRVADVRTGGRGGVRFRGAGMHQVQRGRLVASSGT
jgi:hypothetical protein